MLALALWVSNCRLDRLLGGGAVGAPLEVSPTQVRDSAIAGSEERRDATVLIASAGGWRATKQGSWISLDPTSGGARSLLTISLNPERLTPGNHEGVVTVTSAEDETPVEIGVTFLIQQPILKVTPRDIGYDTRFDRLFLDTLVIENEGDGPLAWTARITNEDDDDDDRDWLTLDATAGQGAGVIPLRVDSDLRTGTYRKSIIVISPGAKNSPTEIKVTLRRRRN